MEAPLLSHFRSGLVRQSRLIAACKPRISLMLESLEERRLLSAPVLDAIGNQSVPANKTIQVPLTAADSDGDTLSYSVSSNSGSVIPTLRSSSNTYLKMTVAGKGDLVFQLFNDVAPETVRILTGLVNGGFYNGLTFHRIIQTFVIQGGDQTGTGAGPSPVTYPDEFNANAIFSGDGQLAMANTGKDTNGTQFFVTKGPQRHLDFNHTIFGQLIRGFDVSDAIAAVPVDGNGKPTTPVVISSAQIIQDKTDKVLQVKVNGTASGTVTVTVNDGHGGTSQRTFTATGETDATNDPPILSPVGNRIIAKNGSVTLTLAGLDPENDDFFASGQFVVQNGASGAVDGKTVTITPKKDFTGSIIVKVGICQTGASARGSTQQDPQDPFNIFDTETITIGVGDKSVSGSGININAAAGADVKGAVVATFTDSDPTGSAGDWSANIYWGDGTDSSTGSIVENSDGTFSVFGSHYYATAANFPLIVTITGNKGAVTVEKPTATVKNIATLTGGVLTVNASSGGDAVNVTRNSDGKIHVNLNGADKKFTASTVSHVEVFGYSGDDTITVGATGVPGTYVDASDGNDFVSGGGANDNLSGGAGKNTLLGNEGDDRVNGSGGRDNLQGGGGNDRLYGFGGNDTMDGGGGVDRLYAGDGDDQLFGASSNDKLYGENGNDSLFGGKGIDLLNGGPGTDDEATIDPGETTTQVEHIL
jgi:cyclophilin family peptidyl-prolyl cis-trans isomerase